MKLPHILTAVILLAGNACSASDALVSNGKKKDSSSRPDSTDDPDIQFQDDENDKADEPVAVSGAFLCESVSTYDETFFIPGSVVIGCKRPSHPEIVTCKTVATGTELKSLILTQPADWNFMFAPEVAEGKTAPAECTVVAAGETESFDFGTLDTTDPTAAPFVVTQSRFLELDFDLDASKDCPDLKIKGEPGLTLEHKNLICKIKGLDDESVELPGNASLTLGPPALFEALFKGIYTVSIWVKFDTSKLLTIGDYVSVLNSRGPDINAPVPLAIEVGTNTSPNPGFIRVLYRPNGSTQNSIASLASLGDNKWRHIGVVNDGQKMVFYVDGELQGETVLSTPGKVSPYPLYLGKASETVGFFTGSFDELQMWPKAYSQQKIKDVIKDDLE